MKKTDIRMISMLIAAGLALGGCAMTPNQGADDQRAANLEQLIKGHNVQQALLISYEATLDGISPKLIVVDANTGKPIPPCGEVKCRAPFDFAKEQRDDAGKEKVEILGEDRYIVRVWKGSVCTTIYSKATGKQYEVCSPPYPKFWTP